MKTIENQGFLPNCNTMGRNVPVKTPAAFKNVNKINGFEHISYGMAVKKFQRWPSSKKSIGREL